MKRMICGGVVYDGTGAPAQVKDILIQDGHIAAVAPNLPREDAEIIDAQGKAVTPGFIDMHRHNDIAPILDPRFGELELAQGITATINGNCGIACVPVRDPWINEYRDFVSPIIGTAPQDALFQDYNTYRTKMEELELPVHMGFLAGTGAVKVAVKGFSSSPYTPSEIEKAQDLVRQAMDAGAFGVSLGFMYQPECYTTPEEQVAVIQPAAKAGGLLTTHIRGEGNTLVESVDEVIDIARKAGIRLHISHLKATGIKNWRKKIFEALDHIERARAEGQSVTADFYPYAGGSTTIFSLIPPGVLKEDNGKTIAYLATAAGKDQLRREIDREDPEWDNMALSIGWDRIVIAGTELPEHAAYSGRTIAELSEENGYEHPADFMADLLVSEMGKVGIIVLSMDPMDVDEVARRPYTALISDSLYGASEHPHPRLYGTFPHFIKEFVRERHVISMEKAIWKMTGFPASILGLDTIGEIKPGKQADLNIFDPEKLIDLATYENSRQLCIGMDRMMIEGQDVLLSGKMTGIKQGRVLRMKS